MEGELRVWWVLRDQDRYGPYTRSELTAMAADGNVVGSDRLWKEGLKAPVLAASVKGLIPSQPVPPPPPSPAQPRTDGGTGWTPPASAAGTASRNPYQAPSAPLQQDIRGGNVEFNHEAATLEAGAGSRWWSDAWELFKLAPLIWVAVGIIFFLLAVLLPMVPGIGALAQSLLTPVFLGGVAAMAHAAHTSGHVDFDRLLDGFRRKFGPLVVLGLLNMALTFAVFLVAGILLVAFIGSGLLHGLLDNQTPGALASQLTSGTALTGILLAALLFLAGLMLIMAAAWYAPPLVLLADMAPMAAMGASFGACMRNWLPMLVYSLIGLLFMVVAMVPFFLGFFVLGPLGFLSIYTSFNQMFARQPA